MLMMTGDKFMTWLMVRDKVTAVQGQLLGLIDDTLWEVSYGSELRSSGLRTILHEKDMLPTDSEKPSDKLGVIV
tara:strand:- start:2474 stop:2695 length:222 start_codon:yes stop_codon:yes gene_type:complete